MITLSIVVEGQTEEDFVKIVLAPHLRARGIKPDPILIGKGGGDVTVEKLGQDMAKLSTTGNCVTTFVDFYGFADKRNATIDQLERKINGNVEQRQRQRVFSYVQKYEFEGLLFSDVSAFSKVIELSKEAEDELQRIRDENNPEDINDSVQTAPSKRIAALIPSYQKRYHGPRIAEKIGLERICNECPRFKRWLTRIEGLTAL